MLEAVFLALRKDNLVEVRRRGQTDGDVIYDLTNAGRSRAAEALARNLYTGPAPVPLREYVSQVQRQSVFGMGVTQQALAEALRGVVIRAEIRDQIGAAMNSDRAIMLYGPAGSGKTFIAEQMGAHAQRQRRRAPRHFGDGEIIRVYDPLVHEPAHEEAAPERSLDNRARTTGAGCCAAAQS